MQEDFVRVYQSPQVMRGNLRPSWTNLRMKMLKICNGDYDLPLSFRMMHYNEYREHEEYGSFVTTIR